MSEVDGTEATSREHSPCDQKRAWRLDRSRYPARPFLRERSIYAVAVYRFGRWNDLRPKGAPFKGLLTRAYWLLYRATEAMTGVSLPKEADFGGGLRIHHAGPVVVHPAVTAGTGTTLRHGVTLGERRPGGGTPKLGDNVEVGAYAQVLGAVGVGSHAKIGAMALVLTDVPEGALALAPKAVVHVRPTAGDGAAS